VRATCATIDLSAVHSNLDLLSETVGPSTQLIPCVKADAYGHGILQVASVCRAWGAKRLGVACLSEALLLRESGDTSEIVVLGPELPEVLEDCAEKSVEISVGTEELAAAVCDYRGGKCLTVHLAVDTGMGRFGLRADEVVTAAIRMSNVNIIGVSTHFPVADTDAEFTQAQLELLGGVVDQLSDAGINPPLIHAENSSGLLGVRPDWLTAARPGLLMYGMVPLEGVSSRFRPVMSLRSKLVRVVGVPAGTSMGYARRWMAKTPRRIATVPIGYGDGYGWSLSEKAEVLVRGRRAPVVGRISMDQTTVDVTDVDGAEITDEVVLIGEQGDDRITAEELAVWGDTVNYEITTRIMPRVGRVYLD